ncbi:protein FAM200C-like [Zophobas morio]|uniref:protein FAM200C-like n=1 Tax=Zophobas morio TaxID=2755281 RepID=UPI0030833037
MCVLFRPLVHRGLQGQFIVSPCRKYQKFHEAAQSHASKRDLKTVHPNLSDRSPEFFSGKLENLKKMKLGPSGSRFESSQKALSASFEISQLIAKSKKPHTIVLRLEAKKKIQEIPLSNNTVKARIETMSLDIEEQILLKIKNSPYFALQCDETTDIATCCQLLVFVRFVDEDNTIKELLLSSALETTSKGIDVMNIISNYLEKHQILWQNLAGLASLVKQKNCSILTTHCIIHRHALASKTLPDDLNRAIKLSIRW